MRRVLDNPAFYFAVILAALYATWNPSPHNIVSAWLAMELPVPVLVLATVALLVVLAVIARAARESIGLVGFLVFFALVGCVFWTVVHFGLVTVDGLAATAGWWAQPVLAAVLTLGLRWPSIYRRLTGVVAVQDQNADERGAAG